MLRKMAVFGMMFVCMAVTASAQECKILRVGGSDGWLPVAYINKETQIPEGIAHDFAKFIGKKLNIPVELNAELPWKRMLKLLELGQMDMCAAIYWTKERGELYQYTESYFSNEARIFVKKGNEFSFEKFEDLIGRSGGIPSGGSFGEEFDSFAKKHSLNLEGVPTKEQRVGKLLAGRNDYFIQDYLDGMMYLKLNGLKDKVVALPHPVSSTEVYFALSRKSPCAGLESKINEIIRNAKQDGTLQTLIDSYVK